MRDTDASMQITKVINSQRIPSGNVAKDQTTSLLASSLLKIKTIKAPSPSNDETIFYPNTPAAMTTSMSTSSPIDATPTAHFD